jgi:DNA-binding CsgD family transcriptional regulator
MRIAKRDRELQPIQLVILQKAADGLSYPLIAKELHHSPGYVKNLAKRTLGVLGADNIAQAVAMAIRRGFIQ